MESARILIVDFDYENITRVSGWLEENGYLILTARNGESGRKLFYSESPDLAIIEPMLPKLHGFELSKEITIEKPDFPIILLSGFYHPEQFRNEELESFGAAAFIKKPPERKSFLAHIRMLLKSRAQPAPPPNRALTPSLSMPPPESKGGFEDGESRGTGAKASSPPDMGPSDFEKTLSLPREKESGEDDDGKDAATAIDAMLADAFSDLVEPALINKPPGDVRTGASAPPPEPSAPKQAEETPEPPSPAGAGSSDQDRKEDEPPVRMESDAVTPQECGEEKEDSAPLPSGSQGNTPSITFSTLEDTNGRRAPSRPVIAGAVILLSLFPAYFILKSGRATRQPAEVIPPAASAGQTGPAAPPLLTKNEAQPKSSLTESNSSVSAGIPGGPASDTVSGGNEPSFENPPPALAPLLPADKPDLGAPRTAAKPPPVLIEGKLAPSPSEKEDDAPPEKTPENGSAPEQEETTVQRGDLLPISRVDAPPVLIRRYDPRYPSSALGTRIAGTVVINVLISEAGDVLEAAVLRGIKGPHDFNGEAVRAVRKWKFTSPEKNGERVRVWKVISIAFTEKGTNHPG